MTPARWRAVANAFLLMIKNLNSWCWRLTDYCFDIRSLQSTKRDLNKQTVLHGRTQLLFLYREVDEMDAGIVQSGIKLS